MIRRAACLLPLACLLPAMEPAVDQDPAAAVQVGGIPVAPAARLAWLDDTLVLHPKVLAGIQADSNPGQRARADGDAGGRLLAGSWAGWAPTRRTGLGLDAEAERRRWADGDGADLDAWRLAGRWTWEGPEDRLTAGTRFARTDEPLEENGAQAPRNVLSGDAGYRWSGASWRVDAGADGRREDFREDVDGFAATRRDRILGRAGLRTGVVLADRTEGWAEVSPGAVRYEQDGPQQDGTVLRGALGGGMPLADRTVLDLRAGVAAWRFADDFAGDPAYGDRREVRPEAQARLTWRWGAEGQVQLSAGQRTLPGFAGNLIVRQEAMLYARTRAGDGVMPFASLLLARNEATGSAAGTTPERYLRWQVQAGLDWYPVRELAVRPLLTGVAGRYRHRDGFERVAAGVEVGMVF